MTDVKVDCVNHLQVTFNLKAVVVDAFVQDQPHKMLHGLRSLLDAFGASVESAGKTVRDTRNEGDPAFKRLGDLARETMSKNPALARRFDRQITVELDDDRNVKAFVASLELGPYDDVIDKRSIKIDAHHYNETELVQGSDSGIVQPPFPPAKTRYVLE